MKIKNYSIYLILSVFTFISCSHQKTKMLISSPFDEKNYTATQIPELHLLTLNSQTENITPLLYLENKKPNNIKFKSLILNKEIKLKAHSIEKYSKNSNSESIWLNIGKDATAFCHLSEEKVNLEEWEDGKVLEFNNLKSRSKKFYKTGNIPHTSINGNKMNFREQVAILSVGQNRYVYQNKAVQLEVNKTRFLNSPISYVTCVSTTLGYKNTLIQLIKDLEYQIL